MQRKTRTLPCALATLAVLSLALTGVAQAQTLPKDAIPIKIEVSGSAITALPAVATEPPIIAFHMVLKGRSDLLGGEVTYSDVHYWQLGLDGVVATATSLGGVFSGPSGDTLHVVWDAVPRPDGVFGGYGRFVVRGGRGKFVGASGSGTMISVLKGTSEVTQVYEGHILLPKR